MLIFALFCTVCKMHNFKCIILSVHSFAYCTILHHSYWIYIGGIQDRKWGTMISARDASVREFHFHSERKTISKCVKKEDTVKCTVFAWVLDTLKSSSSWLNCWRSTILCIFFFPRWFCCSNSVLLIVECSFHWFWPSLAAFVDFATKWDILHFPSKGEKHGL